MINLLNKTNDFHKKHGKFINKKWKGVISEKTRKTCFTDKDLSSWTGLGGPDMTEVRVLVQLRTGPKLTF